MQSPLSHLRILPIPPRANIPNPPSGPIYSDVRIRAIWQFPDRNQPHLAFCRNTCGGEKSRQNTGANGQKIPVTSEKKSNNLIRLYPGFSRNYISTLFYLIPLSEPLVHTNGPLTHPFYYNPFWEKYKKTGHDSWTISHPCHRPVSYGRRHMVADTGFTIDYPQPHITGWKISANPKTVNHHSSSASFQSHQQTTLPVFITWQNQNTTSEFTAFCTDGRHIHQINLLRYTRNSLRFRRRERER